METSAGTRAVLNDRAAGLEDFKVNVRLKLSALWAAVMFCYIYGDIFNFFKPGVLADVLAGRTGAFATQGGLFAASVLMAVPSVMVFLSLAVPPKALRYLSLVLGSLYTLVIAATLPGAWGFTISLGVVESALTLLVVWHAWRWPRLRHGEGLPGTP